jgi:antitoxin ParD1/3/4
MVALGKEVNAMTTMNISLPNDMKAFVEEQALQGGYASASEYLRDLLREAQRSKARLELEAKLLEGMRGMPSKMTGKDWQAIEQEARCSRSARSTRHPAGAGRPVRR